MPRGGKPPVETRFKKGQSGNPGGKPKLAPELRAIKNYHADEIKKIICKYFQMPWAQVLEAVQDTTLPTIELVFASTLNKAILEGDSSRVVHLLDRVVGKVKESPQDITLTLQQVSTVELIQLGREAIKVLEGEVVQTPDSL